MKIALLHCAAAAILAFAHFAGAGCGGSSEDDSQPDTTIEPETTPSGTALFVAVPASISFDAKGGEPADVALRNQGDGGANVANVTLSPSSASELTLESVRTPFIAGGGIESVATVRFTPAPGQVWQPGLIGAVRISTDANNQGAIEVPIYVTGSEPSDADVGGGDTEPDTGPIGPTFGLAFDPPSAELGWLPAGQSEQLSFTLAPTGDGPAVLFGLTLATPNGPGANAFVISSLQTCAANTCASVPGSITGGEVSLPASGIRIGPDEPAQTIRVAVEYTQPPQLGPFVATLTATPAEPHSSATAQIVAPLFKPSVTVSPTFIQFGAVPLGGLDTRSFTVEGESKNPAEIRSIALNGDDVFTLSGEGFALEAGEEIVFEPPITLLSGSVQSFQVVCEPTEANAASGTVLIRTNEPDAPAEGREVGLAANQNPPCLTLLETLVDFGGVSAGLNQPKNVDIIHCGGDPLNLTQIALQPGSDPDFSLDFGLFPGAPVSGPSKAQPTLIPAGGKVTLRVRFAPKVPTPPGPNGPPVPQVATVRIDANTLNPTHFLSAKGVGTQGYCPTPTIDSNAPAPPLTPGFTMQLDGTASQSPAGPVNQYQWTAASPAPIAAKFVPAANSPNPLLELHSVGLWTTSLHVRDTQNKWSCIAAEQSWVVSAPDMLHVELFWLPEQGGAPAADFDLHVAHPSAKGIDADEDGEPDGFFDLAWDVFWFNPAPTFGATLGRQDSSGEGPEFATFPSLESQGIYRIGAHAAAVDTPAFPILRVWLGGELKGEVQGPVLQAGDLWEAAHFDAATGQLTWVKKNGQPKVIANYPLPF